MRDGARRHYEQAPRDGQRDGPEHRRMVLGGHHHLEGGHTRPGPWHGAAERNPSLSSAARVRIVRDLVRLIQACARPDIATSGIARATTHTSKTTTIATEKKYSTKDTEPPSRSLMKVIPMAKSWKK